MKRLLWGFACLLAVCVGLWAQATDGNLVGAAFSHPQYTPSSVNTVRSISRNTTRNVLIPGNPVYNDPTRAFESNARVVTLAARFTF